MMDSDNIYKYSEHYKEGVVVSIIFFCLEMILIICYITLFSYVMEINLGLLVYSYILVNFFLLELLIS